MHLQPLDGLDDLGVDGGGLAAAALHGRDDGSVVDAHVDSAVVDDDVVEGAEGVGDGAALEPADVAALQAGAVEAPGAADHVDGSSSGDDGGAPAGERCVREQDCFSMFRCFCCLLEVVGVVMGGLMDGVDPVVEILLEGRGDGEECPVVAHAVVELVAHSRRRFQREVVAADVDAKRGAAVDESRNEATEVAGSEGGTDVVELVEVLLCDCCCFYDVVEPDGEEGVGGEDLERFLEGDAKGDGVVVDKLRVAWEEAQRTGASEVVDEGRDGDGGVVAELGEADADVACEDHGEVLAQLHGRHGTHAHALLLEDAELAAVVLIRHGEAVPRAGGRGKLDLEEAALEVADCCCFLHDVGQVGRDVLQIDFDFVLRVGGAEGVVELFRPEDGAGALVRLAVLVEAFLHNEEEEAGRESGLLRELLRRELLDDVAGDEVVESRGGDASARRDVAVLLDGADAVGMEGRGGGGVEASQAGFGRVETGADGTKVGRVDELGGRGQLLDLFLRCYCCFSLDAGDRRGGRFAVWAQKLWFERVNELLEMVLKRMKGGRRSFGKEVFVLLFWWEEDLFVRWEEEICVVD